AKISGHDSDCGRASPSSGRPADRRPALRRAGERRHCRQQDHEHEEIELRRVGGVLVTHADAWWVSKTSPTLRALPSKMTRDKGEPTWPQFMHHQRTTLIQSC